MLADRYPEDEERGKAMGTALGGLALGVLSTFRQFERSKVQILLRLFFSLLKLDLRSVVLCINMLAKHRHS